MMSKTVKGFLSNQLMCMVETLGFYSYKKITNRINTEDFLFTFDFVYYFTYSSMSGQLQRFDAYAKTLDDFRVRTTSGGLVTIISTLIIFLLFCLQLQYYLTTDIEQVLFVDTSRQEKMNITIDIRFPILPCSYLTIDAMDVSGESQTDIIHNLYKTRLDLNGNPLTTDMVKVSLQPIRKTNDTQESTTSVSDCESCYGAESDEHKCCPTCDDVKAAYRQKGWSFDASE
jgi:hypothetical protein